MTAIKIKGHIKIISRDIMTNEIIETIEKDNLIVTTGYGLLADVLTGNSAIAYCGVGSGTTAAAIGNTDLETAVGSRKPVTTAARSGAIALFSTFFSSAENNGTWNESVLSTTETGDIINRAVLDTPFVKSSSKTAQVDWTIEVMI